MKKISYKKIIVFILGLIIGMGIVSIANATTYERTDNMICRELSMYYCASSSKEGCHQHLPIYMGDSREKGAITIYRCEDEKTVCFRESKVVRKNYASLVHEVRILNCENKGK